MTQLPRRIDLVMAGARLAVVHGGIERINRFIFASTAATIKANEVERSQADGVIAGHCGLPFTQVVAGRLWHNAGAVGMPANDGTARAWFSLLTPQPDGLAIEHRALTYDHVAAAGKMRRAGLPEDYAAALETGLWPSCDVLPFKEIRERGVPLDPGAVLWRPPIAAASRTRRRPVACKQLWPDPARDSVAPLPREKFTDPRVTAAGEPRAQVSLQRLRTLWFNTGTLCNIACRNCYIESSPKNDRLVYIDRAEVAAYLDEIERDGWDTEEIGFTGGEPFMNPHLFGIIEECLARGFRVLVLTNAMRPMQRAKAKLLDLNRRLGERLTVRVSLDHFTAERHEDERGPGTYQPTLDGLIWLARSGFNVAVAGRTMWGEDEAPERDGYARLFAAHEIPIDAHDPEALVLFPEMDARADVAEIAEGAWGALGKSPADVMCATSRMVVKRKGAERPAVLACTLLPYDPQFELGSTLKDAAHPVPLNHPHCARFCVIGGALCSAG
jgi:pyruvate-formate lyase-activating enzyme